MISSDSVYPQAAQAANYGSPLAPTEDSNILNKEPEERQEDQNPIAVEGARRILSLKWCEPNDCKVRSSTERETIPQGQGSLEIRKQAAREWSINNAKVFLPAVLRASKNVNEITLRTFLIFCLKRLGHAFSLDKYIEALKIYLSVFNDTFTLPQLLETFDLFAQTHPELVSSKMRESIVSTLRDAVYHDNWTDEKVKEITEQILDPAYTSSILLLTGWDWHSTGLVFFKQNGELFYIYINRGSENKDKPGWRLFKVNNITKITPQWIKKIVDRMSSKKTDYTSLETITKELNATEIYYYFMKDQVVGNCTYVTMKGTILALIFKFILENEIPSDKKLDTDFPFNRLVGKAKKVYKPFADFDRRVLIEDSLIDIKNVLNNTLCSEDPKMEIAVITQIAQQVHDKLRNTPTLIFRLGPAIWKDLVISCEQLLKPFELVDKQLVQFAADLENSGNKPKNEDICRLGYIFFTQQSETPWFGDDIVNLLADRKLLMKVLKATKLIENVSDDSKRDIEELFNEKKKLRGHLIQNVCSILLKNLDLEKAEKILKFVPKFVKTSLLQKHSFSIRELSSSFSKEGLYKESTEVIKLISCPWEKMAACSNLARTMSLDTDLNPTGKSINSSKREFKHIDKTFFCIFSDHGKNNLKFYKEYLPRYLSFFEDSFTLPQFLETMKNFVSKHPELVSRELYPNLFQTLIYHNISDEKAKAISACILNPLYNPSIFLFAGWDKQSKEQLIFSKFDEQLFLHTIGPLGGMYKVHKKDKITPEWIKSIVTRIPPEEPDCTGFQKVIKDMTPTWIKSIGASLPFINTKSMNLAQVLLDLEAIPELPKEN